MSEKLAFTIDVDKELKEKAEAVLGKMGLSLEDAVQSLIQKIAGSGNLPFELSLLASEKRETSGLGGDNPENATTLTKAASQILGSMMK